MVKHRTINIGDVARECRTSRTTVSLVLNRRESRISDATRRRVLRTAERLGYRPNRLAQGLQARRSGLIGVLLPRSGDWFADAQICELIGVIQETAARRFRYKLLVEVADEAYVGAGQHLDLCDRQYIDGLLCVGRTSRDKYLRDFSENSFPVIVVDNYLAGIRLNHVRCDYEVAGRLAGEHFLGLGHREFALICGPPANRTTAIRAGFERALCEGGVLLRRNRTCQGLVTEDDGADAVMGLLKRDSAITAILTTGERLAIGAMCALNRLGVGVPRDVSVVGCDCFRPAAFLGSPLTTVCAPIREIGQRACERLMELIHGQTALVEDVLAASLSVRKSTAPPRRDRRR